MWESGGFESGFGGGAKGGIGGGGFMNTSQYGSPGFGGEKKARRTDQNFLPISIRQILQNENETFTIEGFEVSTMSIMGVILSVDTTSTCISFRLYDGTASIDAKWWVDQDMKSGNDVQLNTLRENMYCHAVCSLRTQGGSKYLMIFKVTLIENPNEITTHLLEVMHSVLKLNQVHRIISGDLGLVQQTGGLSNSLVGVTSSAFDGKMISGAASGGTAASGGFDNMPFLSGAEKLVYQVVQSSTEESGTDRNDIFAQLSSRLDVAKINAALDFLTGEGHVYTTVDDDHFRSTDG